MKFTSILVSLFLVSCGGPNFTADIATETDAGSDSNPPLPDTLVSPPDAGRADERGGFESDAASDNTDSSDSNTNDAWPDDVILEPYCLTSEVYPAYSPTCYQWGQTHGWTLPACCLPDHTCGTVRVGACRP